MQSYINILFLSFLKADQIPLPTLRRIASIQRLAYNQINTTWTFDQFIKRQNKYGCHCFTQGKTVGGFGKAVDEIDAACLKLSKCHKCLVLEFGEGKQTDSSTKKYNYEIKVVELNFRDFQ